ncbi:hypothetical protein JT05_02490 [Desulfosporosinus sp. Tol-M]|nr:hypothetical protein JT05_02490 [Desulfosporosinus sp. Tol-M]
MALHIYSFILLGQQSEYLLILAPKRRKQRDRRKESEKLNLFLQIIKILQMKRGCNKLKYSLHPLKFPVWVKVIVTHMGSGNCSVTNFQLTVTQKLSGIRITCP